MPRKYSLGQRAASVAVTRSRILDAAIELYQERGITATTMQDVARRAGVAPGTVLNHFATPDALAAAVADRLSDELRVPGPEIFVEIDSVSERVRRLAHELSDFYERSESWYRVHAREGGRVPAWAEAERRFFEGIAALMGAALGPLIDDERAQLAVSTLLDPGVLTGLRHRGLTSEDAADFVTEILLAWLRAARPNVVSD